MSLPLLLPLLLLLLLRLLLRLRLRLRNPIPLLDAIPLSLPRSMPSPQRRIPLIPPRRLLPILLRLSETCARTTDGWVLESALWLGVAAGGRGISGGKARRVGDVRLVAC